MDANAHGGDRRGVPRQAARPQGACRAHDLRETCTRHCRGFCRPLHRPDIRHRPGQRQVVRR
eukprot:1083844-Prymnesium_polylepis.1